MTRTAESGSRGPLRRPIPEGFRERAAAGASIRQLIEEFGACLQVVDRWVKEIGGKPRAKRVSIQRPMPEDFPAFVGLETAEQLMKRFRVGTALIARWRRQCGGIAPDRQKRHAPEGFREAARHLNVTELGKRFGAARLTVRKWLAECEIRAHQSHAPVKPNLGSMGRPKAAPITQNRDTSRAGMAADYLRKFGPVVRCDATGRFNPTGDHWRRGSAILSADEIIARALRNGWQPDAWKALAA